MPWCELLWSNTLRVAHPTWIPAKRRRWHTKSIWNDIVCSGVGTRDRDAWVVKEGVVIGLGVEGHGVAEVAARRC